MEEVNLDLNTDQRTSACDDEEEHTNTVSIPVNTTQWNKCLY